MFFRLGYGLREDPAMFYDLTVRITPEVRKKAEENDRFALAGHLGTHFDSKRKEFPLDYLRLPAVIFNVSSIRGREITEEDIELGLVKPGTFVCFFTGYEKEFGYGNADYFKDHVVLSNDLLDNLVEKGVHIIGIDAPGVRPGYEHAKRDQYCADRGTFIVENMGGIEQLMQDQTSVECVINTYPVRFSEPDALLCRVVAETS